MPLSNLGLVVYIAEHGGPPVLRFEHNLPAEIYCEEAQESVLQLQLLYGTPQATTLLKTARAYRYGV